MASMRQLLTILTLLATLPLSACDDSAHAQVSGLRQAQRNATFAGATKRITVATFVGILDDVSVAPVGAWSVAVRLDTDYTGNLIRVRRASDNAELNIGYGADNYLNTSALTTHCTGTDCFITTVYEQSGNARDLTQTTASEQPKIYDAATGVYTCGTAAKPCWRGDADSNLTRSDTLGLTGSPNVHIWTSVGETWTTGVAFALGFTGGERLAMESAPDENVSFTTTAGYRQYDATTSGTGWHYYGLRWTAGGDVTTATVEQDGTALTHYFASNDTDTINFSNNGTCWGATSFGGGEFAQSSGEHQTLIVFGQHLTGTDLTNIRNGLAALN